MKKSTIILLLNLVLILSCQKEDLSSCNSAASRLQDKVDFYCGTVVDLGYLDFNTDYKELVGSQFNSATAENIMKPDYLHPAQNYYNWSEADRLADYCQATNKRLHGHTLIWHQQIPAWMENFSGSPTDWDNMFKDHITTIVNHYRGKVTSWDVVNEGFNDDGTLRNTIWKQHIGTDYIEKAFRYAHAADPNAKLFYNDYSLAINPVKRAAIIKYLNQLKAKGVPIDGIGAQMHIFNSFPENVEISKTIDEIWQNDYLVHISEMEVSMNPLSKEMKTAPEDELKRQAEKYLYVFQSYNRIPDKYKFGITIWGVGDQNSWIRFFYNRDDHPLLFDDNFQPKPAYCKLISNL